MKIDGAILEVRSSPHVRAAENLNQADGDVFVMEKSAVEAEPTVAEIGIADETRRGVALVAEEFGERGKRGVERAIGTGGELVGPASGEHAGVRGKGPGGGSAGAVESNSSLCEFCQVGRRVALVAVEAQALGTNGIKHNEQNVRRVPRGRGAGRCSPNFRVRGPRQAKVADDAPGCAASRAGRDDQRDPSRARSRVLS